MNTAPTLTRQLEAFSACPHPDWLPFERANYHLSRAAQYVSAACSHVTHRVYAIQCYDPEEEVQATDNLEWALESAEWHLSQIPAAYRETR